MKVIIIEDEKMAAQLLEQMVLEYDSGIEVLEKCYDLPSGVISIKRNKPDLVFLDLELPGFSGLQLPAFFDNGQINFDIIFTTASSQYAINAFQMGALDYILKPIQQGCLQSALARFIQRRNINRPERESAVYSGGDTIIPHKIIVPVLNGYEVLNLAEVIYLEAEGSYTNIVLKDKKKLLISKNLKYFTDLLQSHSRFLRIHRSFIANLQAVKSILKKDGSYLLMNDNAKLPVNPDKVEQIVRRIQR